MEKYQEIMVKLRQQKVIPPPDDIVPNVMIGVRRVENSFPYKFYRFFFKRHRLSPELSDLLSGKIVSVTQCTFLLFAVGLFYFLLGLLVFGGIKDILASSHVNGWLRFQPYFVMISAAVTISLAIAIWRKPGVIVFAKHVMVAQMVFIVIDAVVVQFMIVSTQAKLFSIMLATAAIVFCVLLISTIRTLIRDKIFISENNFA